MMGAGNPLRGRYLLLGESNVFLPRQFKLRGINRCGRQRPFYDRIINKYRFSAYYPWRPLALAWRLENHNGQLFAPGPVNINLKLLVEYKRPGPWSNVIGPSHLLSSSDGMRKIQAPSLSTVSSLLEPLYRNPLNSYGREKQVTTETGRRNYHIILQKPGRAAELSFGEPLYRDQHSGDGSRSTLLAENAGGGKPKERLIRHIEFYPGKSTAPNRTIRPLPVGSGSSSFLTLLMRAEGDWPQQKRKGLPPGSGEVLLAGERAVGINKDYQPATIRTGFYAGQRPWWIYPPVAKAMVYGTRVITQLSGKESPGAVNFPLHTGSAGPVTDYQADSKVSYPWIMLFQNKYRVKRGLAGNQHINIDNRPSRLNNVVKSRLSPVVLQTDSFRLPRPEYTMISPIQATLAAGVNVLRSHPGALVSEYYLQQYGNRPEQLLRLINTSSQPATLLLINSLKYPPTPSEAIAQTRVLKRPAFYNPSSLKGQGDWKAGNIYGNMHPILHKFGTLTQFSRNNRMEFNENRFIKQLDAGWAPYNFTINEYPDSARSDYPGRPVARAATTWLFMSLSAHRTQNSVPGARGRGGPGNALNTRLIKDINNTRLVRGLNNTIQFPYLLYFGLKTGGGIGRVGQLPDSFGDGMLMSAWSNRLSYIIRTLSYHKTDDGQRSSFYPQQRAEKASKRSLKIDRVQSLIYKLALKTKTRRDNQPGLNQLKINYQARLNVNDAAQRMTLRRVINEYGSLTPLAAALRAPDYKIAAYRKAARAAVFKKGLNRKAHESAALYAPETTSAFPSRIQTGPNNGIMPAQVLPLHRKSVESNKRGIYQINQMPAGDRASGPVSAVRLLSSLPGSSDNEKTKIFNSVKAIITAAAIKKYFPFYPSNKHVILMGRDHTMILNGSGDGRSRAREGASASGQGRMEVLVSFFPVTGRGGFGEGLLGGAGINHIQKQLLKYYGRQTEISNLQGVAAESGIKQKFRQEAGYRLLQREVSKKERLQTLQNRLLFLSLVNSHNPVREDYRKEKTGSVRSRGDGQYKRDKYELHIIANRTRNQHRKNQSVRPIREHVPGFTDRNLVITSVHNKTSWSALPVISLVKWYAYQSSGRGITSRDENSRIGKILWARLHRNSSENSEARSTGAGGRLQYWQPRVVQYQELKLNDNRGGKFYTSLDSGSDLAYRRDTSPAAGSNKDVLSDTQARSVNAELTMQMTGARNTELKVNEIKQIADRVYREIQQRMKVERQCRGL